MTLTAIVINLFYELISCGSLSKNIFHRQQKITILIKEKMKPYGGVNITPDHNLFPNQDDFPLTIGVYTYLQQLLGLILKY
jgi:hypothetical protein